MMHGMPAALTTHQCPAGVLNCVRILASKSRKWWISDRWCKISADETGNNAPMLGWGCGLKMTRDGCVKGKMRTITKLTFSHRYCSGLPQGIVFEGGDDDVSSITTCFCGSDLCNTEHWCDGCQLSSSSSLVPALASLALLTLAALIAWSECFVSGVCTH